MLLLGFQGNETRWLFIPAGSSRRVEAPELGKSPSPQPPSSPCRQDPLPSPSPGARVHGAIPAAYGVSTGWAPS